MCVRSLRILTSGGPSGIMDLNAIPGLQAAVEELLRQTGGSPLEREQVAAVVRERVMAAPMPAARIDAAAATPVAHDCAPNHLCGRILVR